MLIGNKNTIKCEQSSKYLSSVKIAPHPQGLDYLVGHHRNLTSSQMGTVMIAFLRYHLNCCRYKISTYSNSLYILTQNQKLERLIIGKLVCAKLNDFIYYNVFLLLYSNLFNQYFFL